MVYPRRVRPDSIPSLPSPSWFETFRSLSSRARSTSQSASEGEVLFALAAPVLGAAAGGIVGFLVGKLITGPRWQDVEFD